MGKAGKWRVSWVWYLTSTSLADGRCDHVSRSKALLGQYCRHHVCSRRRLACRELRPSFLNIVASMTSGLPHRRYLSHSMQHTIGEESHEIRFGIQQFQYFALIARYVRGPPLPVIYARYRAARGSFFFFHFQDTRSCRHVWNPKPKQEAIT